MLDRFVSLVFGLYLLSLFGGCTPIATQLDPNIFYVPHTHMIQGLPAAFAELTPEELSQPWGKEYYVGKAFAREMDLYRAITCFKSALFLIPCEVQDRRLEIEYEIFLAYYLGNKFEEAVDAFESSNLFSIPKSFPPLQDLLVTLYDAYMKCGRTEKAYGILHLLSIYEETRVADLCLSSAISEADFPAIVQTSLEHTSQGNIQQFLADYHCTSKSIKTAQTLNAIFPGAGYFYVGQKKAGLTSFFINLLFIAASYQLFERGYIPAAIITTSLEMGWYFGGIHGAGLAAKEWNERQYETLGRECLIENKLFPILMLQMSF